MPMPATIVVAPADLTVTVIDGAMITEPYTATLVASDGTMTDVTSTATFTLADASFGVWTGPSLVVDGGGAGPTRVVATIVDTMGTPTIGDTGLTVMVQGSRSDGTGVPANPGGLFGAATDTPASAPTVAYPADNILVPPNLGEFDVHWQGGANDLFEISLHNQYVDLKIYKAGSGAQFTTYSPTEWYTLASAHAPLTLTVSGLVQANPTVKGTSTPQTVGVTNEIVAGGVYYWTTEPAQGVYRYDMSTPTIPPASYFPMGNNPTPCIGCHGLSRDGTKMALTLDSGNGRGTIFNVADRAVLVPFDPNAPGGQCNPAAGPCWNFATFTPDATKLVTVFQGQMVLRNTAGGAVISSLTNSPGLLGDHPELSPDGKTLANVETTQDFADYQIQDGSIVTRTFDDATNTFGAIKMLVPQAPGASNYYPSWSPDGQWIAFTRTAGNSYNDTSAEVWIIKADGTQAPIQLNLADLGVNLTNSWARWAPFAQSSGANAEPLFYLTFSTTRPFGVRPTGGTQIWMTPVFPDRAAAGQDPSGPSFRMPFQRIDTSNHIAQWTQQVVVVQ
jgi:hypothetical protein